MRINTLIHPRFAVVAHDLFMVWVAWSAAMVFRYSLVPGDHPVALLSQELVVVLAIQGGVFWWTGLYQGVWRFASIPDLWNIVRACWPDARDFAVD